MPNIKKKLNENQQGYIKDNYNSVSIRKMAEYLNINTHLIKVFMKENNLIVENKIRTVRKCDYTDDEINFIKENYLTMSYKDIAKSLNKTASAIGTKINKMGLDLKSEKWSELEVNILLERYPYSVSSYIQKKYLPNKTVGNINRKAIELGLIKISRNRFNKEDLKKMLIEFSLELGRTPTVGDLAKNENIPTEGTYSKYFGSYENACLECGLIPNICLFGKYSTILIAKDNVTTCLSNSELTITNYLIDNNIKFEKEKCYSDLSNNESFGLKRCDWYLSDFDVVVEYFGLPNKQFYKVKMDEKIRLCEENNIKLISITDRRLTKKFLDNKFKEYI